MLFILHATRTFLELATGLGAYGLSLDEVRACTFPGRPEPRSARFVHEATPYFDYRYLPDLEVRALGWSTRSLPDIKTSSPDLEALLCGLDLDDDRPWFERWDELERDLYEGTHQRAQRAAASWRVRGQWDDERAEQSLGVLLDGLREGSLSARRACAEQLCVWPRHAALQALRDVYEQEQDLEVRASVRRALERIEVLDMVGRR